MRASDLRRRRSFPKSARLSAPFSAVLVVAWHLHAREWAAQRACEGWQRSPNPQAGRVCAGQRSAKFPRRRVGPSTSACPSRVPHPRGPRLAGGTRRPGWRQISDPGQSPARPCPAFEHELTRGDGDGPCSSINNKGKRSLTAVSSPATSTPDVKAMVSRSQGPHHGTAWDRHWKSQVCSSRVPCLILFHSARTASSSMSTAAES
jgi:hypothetical protein